MRNSYTESKPVVLVQQLSYQIQKRDSNWVQSEGTDQLANNQQPTGREKSTQ